MKRIEQRVYLVTWGAMSESVFVSSANLQDLLKSIPANERACALITETSFEPSDLELIERSNRIIKRLENEITEVKMNLSDRINKRKRA